jgi:hypothetical protein
VYKGNLFSCFLEEIYRCYDNFMKMAKTYKRSGSGGKSTWTKKTKSKTKTTGRVSKKSGGKPATAKLKTIIAQEVRNELRSGVQSEKKKVTMELRLSETGIYLNGKAALNNCLRIPITKSIPAQAGAGQAPDERRRDSNKIKVTGVNVRASFSVSDELRMAMFVYEPHQAVRLRLDKVPLETVPSASAGHVPEEFKTMMVPFENLGVVSNHGPLMVKKAGSQIALDSVDGSVFESRVAKHAGRPIGAVFRKKFGGGGLRRTLNWNQSAADGVGLGYTAWTTHMVNEFFEVNKTYSYMYEVSNDQQFERDAEMLMYVDCPSLEGITLPDTVPVAGAKFRNVIIDVYYHDVPK